MSGGLEKYIAEMHRQQALMQYDMGLANPYMNQLHKWCASPKDDDTPNLLLLIEDEE